MCTFFHYFSTKDLTLGHLKAKNHLLHPPLVIVSLQIPTREVVEKKVEKVLLLLLVIVINEICDVIT